MRHVQEPRPYFDRISCQPISCFNPSFRSFFYDEKDGRIWEEILTRFAWSLALILNSLEIIQKKVRIGAMSGLKVNGDEESGLNMNH